MRTLVRFSRKVWTNPDESGTWNLKFEMLKHLFFRSPRYTLISNCQVITLILPLNRAYICLTLGKTTGRNLAEWPKNLVKGNKVCIQVKHINTTIYTLLAISRNSQFLLALNSVFLIRNSSDRFALFSVIKNLPQT